MSSKTSPKKEKETTTKIDISFFSKRGENKKPRAKISRINGRNPPDFI